MSKDYTKYAKIGTEVETKAEPIPEKVFVTGTTCEPITEIVEPTVAEVATSEVEPTIDEAPVITPAHKYGRVVNCEKLNVRKEPKSDAPIIHTLFRNAEVEVHEFGSTDEFYMVYTAAGITGFCIKTYIAVK